MSEFGKGLTYCLGLFLAHTELHRDFEPRLWFNGASDHLYDLQIDYAPEKLRDRLKSFQEIVLEWGHGVKDVSFLTQKDVEWALETARELLRLIDEENGVPTEKGDWE